MNIKIVEFDQSLCIAEHCKRSDVDIERSTVFYDDGTESELSAAYAVDNGQRAVHHKVQTIITRTVDFVTVKIERNIVAGTYVKITIRISDAGCNGIVPFKYVRAAFAQYILKREMVCTFRIRGQSCGGQERKYHCERHCDAEQNGYDACHRFSCLSVCHTKFLLYEKLPELYCFSYEKGIERAAKNT